MTVIERHGMVAVLRLDHGKVHALDDVLLSELAHCLDEVERSDARAVVLTAAGRVFSAGVDLQKVLDGGAEYLERMMPVLISAFVRLFSYPLPVVAAVNGPAVAGGCILACACDRRIMAAGGRIGASELLVGVPFPVSALEILRWACGDRTEEVVLSGKLYGSDEAMSVGLAHEVVPSDALLERALAVAGELGAVAPEAFRLAKAQLRRPAIERITVDAPLVDPAVRALWASAETTASISAQVDRMSARRNR
ncbi:MAG TPA: enoyl-CoA hydratase/isomerase family protein [Acidimicrobiales bacterium]|nr:enoyl-CoA hydratase/isomerase family protein [Acidimicrobiales bacterium]